MGPRGAGGVKNFSVGIYNGTPSTARSSFFLVHYSLFIIKNGHYSLIIIPHLDPQICSEHGLARTETRGHGHSDLETVGESPGSMMYLHNKYGMLP